MEPMDSPQILEVLGHMEREWTPDWVVHPGALLGEALTLRGWTQAEFARCTGYTHKRVNRIVRGHDAMDPEVCVWAERELGIPARLFVCMQAVYDLEAARRTIYDRTQAALQDQEAGDLETLPRPVKR